MIEDNQPKAFDPKMMIAIFLMVGFYFAWNQYLAKKYPQPKKAAESSAQKIETLQKQIEEGTAPSSPEVMKVKAPVVQLKNTQIPERLYTFEDDKVSFKISSVGMAISGFNSKVYFDRKGQPITLSPTDPGLFEMTWGPEKQKIDFQIQEVEKGQFIGTAQIGSFKIERQLKYNSTHYAFDQQISIQNPENIPAEFFLTSHDKILKPESSSWLFPSYEHQDFLTFTGGKQENFNTSRASENLEKSITAINMYSLGTQYFTVGFLDQSEILPNLKMSSQLNSGLIVHEVDYKLPQAQTFLFKQKLFVGPKSSDSLRAAHENFLSLMDYGMLSFISKPMLASMKWFYSMMGNWGWAIVFLTLLVRAIVLPFNLMSYRSMKGMQKIQPELTALRERYKDDPVNLNREMMAIMKNNNANPLAGCLPILLQIPIFFALYRVIGSSVELYQAPFGLWIQDLSLHDKFYVLPILMGITMFIQQKLTPTTLDPVQAKILTWMPVIFCLFMLNLPAGLTLYMVVSAVFGIIQQKTFMALMKA